MPPRLGILVVRRLIVGFLHPARDARQVIYTIRKPVKSSIEWYMSHLSAMVVAGAVVDFVAKSRVSLG